MLFRFFEKYYPIILALAINFFYLMVCFSFCGKVYFGAIDDYFMARTLEGVFSNDYNVHMTFINVIYGYILLPLYHVFPKLGWFYLGEIAEIFISFVTISFIIIKKAGIRQGTILSILFFFFFARDYYLTVQFTLCASALGAAGMLLLLYDIQSSKHKMGRIFFGAALLLLSAIMRKDAFLMGIPLCACAVFFLANKCFHSKQLFLVTLAILFAVLWGIDKFNQSHYTSTEYQKYKSFQAPRVVLGDKSNYDKDLICDELEEKNFSCEDYQLLKQWVFYDTKIFSIDSLQNIATLIKKSSYPLKWQFLTTSILNRLDGSVTKPGFWAFISFCLILFRNGKKGYAWGSLFVTLSLMAYLLYMQRLVYRVETGLWLYATTFSIPFWGVPHKTFLKHFFPVTFVILVVITVFFACSGTFVRDVNRGKLWNIEHRSQSARPKYEALFNYIQSSADSSIFLSKMSTYMSFSYYKRAPYLSEPFGSWKKIIPLGYWTPYFPDIEKHLYEVGVSNPIHDVVKENVFVINETELSDFLQRHYYDSVYVQEVQKFDDLKIFKYFQIKNNETP